MHPFDISVAELGAAGLPPTEAGVFQKALLNLTRNQKLTDAAQASSSPLVWSSIRWLPRVLQM